MSAEPHSEGNAAVWRGPVFQAWCARFGEPAALAAELVQRPRAKLAGLDVLFEALLGDLRGRSVLNLMGSNGLKAVALALLGAEVSVIDYAPGNGDYARALATAAGVALRYEVGDVLELPNRPELGNQELIFAELGIVHYFQDLAPFAAAVVAALAPGGHFVLRDFHPVATKLLSFRGSSAKVRKVRVTGDYFDTRLHPEDAPFAKHLPPEQAALLKPVLWRRWTLGEIVTAMAASGLRIRSLVEEPNRSNTSPGGHADSAFDQGIPKTFTLVASKD
jgi:SAM-dependent methyltransferase